MASKPSSRDRQTSSGRFPKKSENAAVKRGITRRLARVSAALLLLRLSGCRAEKPAPAVAAPREPSVEFSDGDRQPAPPSQVRRVIWIGLDGADREYLDSLAAQGQVPNWKRLSGEGFVTPLESFIPMLSPLIWTTQETGVGPDVHRVLDFQEVDPRTNLLVPVSEASRKVPAVWNIASENGRKVGVVGFWATHPAEKVNGFFLSDRIDPARSGPAPGGVGYPESLDETVRRVVERDGSVAAADLADAFGIPRTEIAPGPGRKEGFEDPITALSGVLTSTRVTQRLSRELYDREHPDFLAVYFEGTDSIGHLFAPYAPPRLAASRRASSKSFAGSRRPISGRSTRFSGSGCAAPARITRSSSSPPITAFAGEATGPANRGSTEEATAANWHRSPGVLVAWERGSQRFLRARRLGLRLWPRPCWRSRVSRSTRECVERSFRFSPSSGSGSGRTSSRGSPLPRSWRGLSTKRRPASTRRSSPRSGTSPERRSGRMSRPSHVGRAHERSLEQSRRLPPVLGP